MGVLGAMPMLLCAPLAHDKHLFNAACCLPSLACLIPLALLYLSFSSLNQKELIYELIFQGY